MKRLIFIILLFTLACYKTYEVKTRMPEFNLSFLDSLRLANPVSAIGLDTDAGILLLETSGAKILKLSSNLIVVDSIILPQRLFYPKGLSADAFFIYIYTENGFYRFDRQGKTLKPIMTGIKPRGMAVVNTNEVYLSDPQNNRIIVVDATGYTKDFIKQPERFEPTGLIYDAKEGTIWVIDDLSQAIESYNRIGNLKASIAIYNLTFDDIGLSEEKSLFLISKDGTAIWRIDRQGQIRLYRGPNRLSFVATDICLGKDRIFILDYQNRVLSFKLPH